MDREGHSSTVRVFARPRVVGLCREAHKRRRVSSSEEIKTVENVWNDRRAVALDFSIGQHVTILNKNNDKKKKLP